MNRLRKNLITLFVLTGLLILLYWAEKNDYFKSEYKDLTALQQSIFEWQARDDGEKLMQRFRQHFLDSQYLFPRQKVTKVKLFRNIPIVSVLSSRTLKQEYVTSFVGFCNDTTNFHWDETKWQLSESKYYCRLYNADGNVAGKIYFCLDGCGMTSSRPFTPTMKFGGLTPKGMNYIQQLFGDNTKWE